ncbi:MAG TPA: ABC transporter permease subunit [Candidatus Nanoarchaeia archaeon]|nr:ABC transporter permease subunit [Candidatus Nanoarchaeia archaeon]
MNKNQYFKTIWTLFKKELMSYFNSPIAYIFIAVFLVAGNWLFFQNFFIYQQATMREYFALLPWIFLFLSPAVTMRLWSEEKKSGTIEFLLTLPITTWQAVLAKFFGALAFMMIALALTFTIPVTISFLGQMDFGPLWGSYLGSIFLAGAYLSLGLFMSALTKNQIIAFVLGLVACFAALIIGSSFVLMAAPSAIAALFAFLGLGTHFDSIARGVIDSQDIVYYLTFIFLFLWLNAQVIQKRAWR